VHFSPPPPLLRRRRRNGARTCGGGGGGEGQADHGGRRWEATAAVVVVGRQHYGGGGESLRSGSKVISCSEATNRAFDVAVLTGSSSLLSSSFCYDTIACVSHTCSWTCYLLCSGCEIERYKSWQGLRLKERRLLASRARQGRVKSRRRMSRPGGISSGVGRLCLLPRSDEDDGAAFDAGRRR
jgi:hypothetical protein